MLLPTIHEIAIFGVFDRGVPNKERIILRPTEIVDLGGFGLYIGKMMPNNMIWPYPDNFLWLGNLIVQPPAWIFIYTGLGQFQESKLPITGHQAYTYHWGKKFTVFDDPQSVPVLFKYSGIAIGQPQPHPTLPPIKG